MIVHKITPMERADLLESAMEAQFLIVKKPINNMFVFNDLVIKAAEQTANELYKLEAEFMGVACAEYKSAYWDEVLEKLNAKYYFIS